MTHLELPRPFLKWVGGKGQLLDELLKRVDLAGGIGRYHEPFVGGGALFYAMVRTKRLGKKKAYLSDYNPRLVATYQGVKDDVDGVIKRLLKHKKNHGEDYYYRVREDLRDDIRNGGPKNTTEHAARIIYLNKTGYNGLYRENSKGLYNVPFGRYKNPLICDEANLRACSEALNRANISHSHFADIVERAQEGDFVYFDPPYHPISDTASFTSYTDGIRDPRDLQGFGPDSQRLLALTFRELSENGVKVLLSNSDTPFVHELYEGFQIDTVSANRSVNSNPGKRGAIQEALVRNF